MWRYYTISPSNAYRLTLVSPGVARADGKGDILVAIGVELLLVEDDLDWRAVAYLGKSDASGIHTATLDLATEVLYAPFPSLPL